MRIVIDTHILIWLLEGDIQLSESRRAILANPTNQIFVSIASLWETAIKISSGKLSLSKPLSQIIDEITDSSSLILHIEPEHTLVVSTLPLHHRDPFDRIIISQAQVENLSVMTHDGAFADYGITLL